MFIFISYANHKFISFFSPKLSQIFAQQIRQHIFELSDDINFNYQISAKIMIEDRRLSHLSYHKIYIFPNTLQKYAN